MKIFKKRCLAFFIDSFSYGMLKVIFCEYVLTHIAYFPMILLEIPFLFVDFLFRNASFGKKIMGIAIYTTSWEIPNPKLILKRALYMYVLPCIIVLRTLFGECSLFVLFECEKNVVGTFTIDKKVYKELKEKAKQMDGVFEKNMTELYMMYLRDFYQK